MTGWLKLLKGLGIDTASHRALLIQQHGLIGTEILQRDVFANVWSEQTQRLWRNVARNGPNLVLRVLTFLAVLLLAWVVAHAIRFLLKAIIDTSEVHLARLGPSEMVFAVQPWVRTENYWQLQRSLLKEIRQRFARDGIACIWGTSRSIWAVMTRAASL
jgi:small-conductance mechanosensitive channel